MRQKQDKICLQPIILNKELNVTSETTLADIQDNQ